MIGSVRKTATPLRPATDRTSPVPLPERAWGRAALRRAARQLGWRVLMLGHAGERLVLVLVHDRREAPEPFDQALEEHRLQLMRDARDRSSPASTGNWDDTPRGPPDHPVPEAARTALARASSVC